MTSNIIVEQAVNPGIKRYRTKSTDNITVGTASKVFSGFGNQLVRTLPTLIAYPWGRDGSQQYTNLSAGGTGTIDNDVVDPTTSLSMINRTSPADNTGLPAINYNNLTPFTMADTDVWLLSIYIEGMVPENLTIKMFTSSNNQVIIGSNERSYSWTTDSKTLLTGHNIIPFLHVEDLVSDGEFGHVGTTDNAEWIENGNTSSSIIGSIKLQIGLDPALPTDTSVWFGAIHTAPSGWCKPVFCFGFDDVPKSGFYLGVPVLEQVGFKSTLNITSANLGDPTATDTMTMTDLLSSVSRGHEIWSHGKTHQNLSDLDLATKTRQLTMSRNFWNSIGIQSAAKFVCYPEGGHDEELLTLLPTLGYKLGTTTKGTANCPWIPGVRRFTLSRYSFEQENSWKVDSLIRGAYMRGQCLILFGHNAVAGGGDSDVRPALTSFYVEHLKRWRNLVHSYYVAGEAEVTTISEYYKLCGIDPYTHEFTG